MVNYIDDYIIIIIINYCIIIIFSLSGDAKMVSVSLTTSVEFN